jgi:hypothetical protein
MQSRLIAKRYIIQLLLQHSDEIVYDQSISNKYADEDGRKEWAKSQHRLIREQIKAYAERMQAQLDKRKLEEAEGDAVEQG